MKNIIILFLIVGSLSSCTSQVEGVTLITAQEAKVNLEKDSNIQLIDVRTAEEFSTGHIAKAGNYCLTNDELKQKMTNLDKDKPVYVYCKSGGRSSKASRLLVENGFKHVYDISGGITAWEGDGLEISD